jgi:dipeptidyl aminopeptidase/acylaminoacyl peptidase
MVETIGIFALQHSDTSQADCSYRFPRERLVGSWGVFDVNDAADAVNQLGKRELIDPKRAVIRGESAGGFTALATLSTRPEAFAAGAALYGASDLVTLQRAMPKFQSHYLKRLIGGEPDEAQYLWKGRSPLTNAANIKVPLLVRSVYYLLSHIGMLISPFN